MVTSAVMEGASEPQDAITRCERRLAAMYGRKHCILTGNGTLAIHLACRLADPGRPEVLLPAMVCLEPVLGVYHADRIPLFADVLEGDATLDPRSVSSMVARNGNIGAVLAVHLYGHAAAMESLREVTHRHGLLLIEDLAQAMGGRFQDGTPFGRMGDCVILSFGHTKILDAGGGGALLTDRDDWALQARARSLQWGLPTVDREQLSRIYRRLYYAIWESGQQDPRFYELFDHFPRMFQSMKEYAVTVDDAVRIIDILEQLPGEMAHRQSMARVYAERLGRRDGIGMFRTSEHVVPWRFTVRVPADRRQGWLHALRSAGYDASSWYPCIAGWTPSGRRQGQHLFPVANRLEREVVNLWVTRDYSEEKIVDLTQYFR
ncbi:MAG: DegT/DnrJ/EryC1/StrS family aminotransferase [Magnetococcales bacterium]|nr:DegT/DnrJ/EryC1/StrS family aminotransferase [Magnetococcales bacterium]